LTQEELAEMAGTSRATVNGVLRREQELGRVDLRRGRVVATDLTELRRQADRP
jgi:CRP/FNR family cyclic AMP-dependent transcriptional regulator